MRNLLFIFMLGGVLPLLAQTEPLPKPRAEPRFTLSLFGGLNASKMPYISPLRWGQETLQTRNQYAYFVGVAARQSFSRRWAGLLESQFSVRGYGEPTLLSSDRWKINYLDFMPQLEVKASRKWRFSAGFYTGFSIEEFFKYRESQWRPNPFGYRNLKNYDIGNVFGAEIQWPKFVLMARYLHGWTKVKEDTTYTDEYGREIDFSQRSRSVQMGVKIKVW